MMCDEERRARKGSKMKANVISKTPPYCSFCGAHVGEVSKAGEFKLVKAIYYCETCQYQYCTSCCDTTINGTEAEAECVRCDGKIRKIN
jgi:uncharacterized paraquat-inducible protein A